MGSDTGRPGNTNFRDVFVDCQPRLKPNTILFKTGRHRTVRIEPRTVTVDALVKAYNQARKQNKANGASSAYASPAVCYMGVEAFAAFQRLPL